jgi:hypothetical protein
MQVTTRRVWYYHRWRLKHCVALYRRLCTYFFSVCMAAFLASFWLATPLVAAPGPASILILTNTHTHAYINASRALTTLSKSSYALSKALPVVHLTQGTSVQGELAVTLMHGEKIPVWGFPWQSNPYCRLVLGTQAVDSKRERETGGRGSFRNPTWNQDFQFLVEDRPNQYLKITIYDSPYTGRSEVGHAKLLLDTLPRDGTLMASLPVQTLESDSEPVGTLTVRASLRAFDDEVGIDSGTRLALESQNLPHSVITDVQSAAEASAAATVEASQGLEALAVAKAAAARAAARLGGQGREEEMSEGSWGLRSWGGVRAMKRLGSKVLRGDRQRPRQRSRAPSMLTSWSER